MYSLRFPDGCIFHNNIERKNLCISLNQQITEYPTLYLEVEEPIVPIDHTSHYEWESCPLVNQHCSRHADGQISSFEHLHLYKDNIRESEDAWHFESITWCDNIIRHVYKGFL